ncbi:MAG: ABC transporter permease [Microbacteriaceae bacterium]
MATATTTATEPKRRFDAWTFVGNFGALILLLIIIVVAAILQPTSFATWYNLVNILGSSAVTAVIAVGLTIPIVAGEFDLSIGYQASLSGILGLAAMELFGMPLWLGVLVSVLTGSIIGLGNGLLVAKLKINALVATLGMGTLVLGLSYAITQGVPVVLTDPASITWVSIQQVLGLPIPVWIALIFAALLWVGLNRTGIGMAVKAIGGNAEAARLSGVSVDWVRIGAFIVAGFAAGLGGIMIASRTGSAAVDSGNSYLLSSFAAVFFGSAVMSAGRFHIIGTLVGVLTVSVTFNVMAITGLPTAYQYVFQGVLLLLGVGIGTVSRTRAARSA